VNTKTSFKKSVLLFLSVTILLVVIAVLIPAFTKILDQNKTNTYKISFTDPLNFSYSPEKITIDGSGARLIDINEKGLVETSTPITLPKDVKLLGFKEVSDKKGNSDISYRVTTSSNSWYYFDGSNWRIVPESCKDCTNNAQEIDKNIGSLPIESTNLKINTYLSSTSKGIPILNSIKLITRGNEIKRLYAEKPNYKFQSSYAEEGADNCVCKDAIKTLQLKYVGPSDVTINIYEEDNHKKLFKTFSGVSNGDILTFSGSLDNAEKIKDKLFFEIPNSGIADIDQYVKCDKIKLGLVFGNFTVVGYTDKEDHICNGASTNQAPIINDDTATTPKNVTVIVDVLLNDLDSDGTLSPSTVIVTTSPTNGIIANINSNTGEISYTPSNDYTGTDTFVYKACDNFGLCDEANVTVNISGGGSGSIIDGKKDSFYGNATPQCFMDMPVGTLYTYLDASGNLYIYYEQSKNVVDNTYGTNIVNWSRSHSFSDLVGSDGAQFNIKDSLGNTVLTFNSDYVSSNNALTSKYGCLGVAGGEGGITVGSAANILGAKTSIDYNLNVLGCAFTTNSPPADASYNPTDGSCPSWIFEDSYEVGISKNAFGANGFGSVDVVYVHDSPSKLGTNKIIPDTCGGGSCGNGTIEQGEQCDDGNTNNGDGCSATCQKETTNKKPPVAKNDNAKTFQDEPVTIDVLANDSDPDGNIDPTTVTITTNPTHGTVSVDPVTGEVTYTPDSGFSGKDKFRYTVKDSGGLVSNIAEVTIDIDKNPTACGCYKHLTKLVLKYNGTQSATIKVIKEKGTTAYFEGNVLPGGQITAYNGGSSLGDSVQVYINGILNASFDADCDIEETTGKETEVGLVVGFFEVISGQSDKAHPICGSIQTNLPPIADDDSATTLKNTPTTINVLSNDSDPDGYLVPSTVTVTVNPSHGTTTINSTTGAITYTPNNNFTGTDVFTYQVCDNEGLCDTAVVTIIVNKTENNKPPVAKNETVHTLQDEPVDIDILANDSDPDGTIDPTTVIITTNPSNGTVSVNPTTGEVTYTPIPGFSGQDKFYYTVKDNLGLISNIAEVKIYVDKNPNSCGCYKKLTKLVLRYNGTTSATLKFIKEGGTTAYFEGTVSPGELITAYNGGSGLGDSVQVYINGILNATFDADCDEEETSGKETEVGLVVGLMEVMAGESYKAIPLCSNVTNLPPIANDNSATTLKNTPVAISVLNNDSDPDGILVPSTVTVTVNPNHGTTTINSITGVITYTPNNNFTGIDTFTYQVCDDGGLCDTAIVTVNVNAIAQPPVAVDDSAATPKNTPTTIDVLLNDYGISGNLVPSSVVITVPPAHGTVTNINPANGEITYTPYNNFTGNDSFTYSVCDTNSLCDTAVVAISINANPLPPVANDDTTATIKNNPVVIDVLVNDFDPDGYLIPSTVSITVNPNNGTITNINTTTGEITYSPNNNFTGTDTFNYQVCDNNGLCDTALVTITIEKDKVPICHYTGIVGDLYVFMRLDEAQLQTHLPHTLDIIPITDRNGDGKVYKDDCDYISNLPPIANNDSVNTNEDTPTTINVLANDIAVSSPLVPSSVIILSNPSHGTITGIDPITGIISYTPNTGYNGTDTFTYRVCDGNGLCDSATVTVNVLGANLPPIANNDTASTIATDPVVIGVLLNDSDPDGTLNPASVTVTVPPSNGVITNINPINGNITYTANPGFYGTDNFTYQVCDNEGLCATATVSITVKARPIAQNDSAFTDKNKPVEVDVLNNDSTPSGTLVPSSVVVTSNPSNGTVTVDSTTGKITYNPLTNFTGVDSFEYQVCNSYGLCDTATVNIGVSSKLPPVANDDSSTTNQNTPVVINILSNDTAPSGTINPATVNITSNPANGIVTVDSTTGQATYTPNIGFYGTDVFTYIVKDSNGLESNIATVTITIKAPPIANNDETNTPYNTPVVVNILGNDLDPDGSLVPSTVAIISDPTHGTIIVDTTNGKVTYTPNTGYYGTDSFTYQVKDNDGLLSNIATATINVGPPGVCVINCGGGPSSPVAVNDNVTTNKNQDVVIDILINDFAPSGYIINSSVTITSDPKNGTITNIDKTTGKVTYTPNTDFTGIDTFVYKILDNNGLSATALVTVTISPKVPPVAVNDSAATPIGTPVVIDVLINDSDPDGTLNNGTVQVITNPLHGTITNIDPLTGKVTYQPDPGFNGIDTFVYKVKDNDGLDSNPATVTIGVGTILPPVANDDVKNTNPNTPTSIDILANDIAQSGTLVPATVKITKNPTNGTITNVNTATGVVDYTPNIGFIGLDTFNYEVCNSNGLCDTAVVTINVGITLPPIANPDVGVAPVDTPIVTDVLVNDVDPGGNLIPATTKLITPPVNGIITTINPINGNITYVPAVGFVGADTYIYEVCNGAGLCATAAVTITVLPPAPAVISINAEFCNGRVYTTPDIGFVGTITNVPNSITAIQYSLDGGTTWIPVATVPAPAAPGGLYTFATIGLPDGVYNALARSISTTGVITISPICNFSVALEKLIFGANQFVTISRSSPLSNSGVIQFVENTPQILYLEAQGATDAYIEATPTTLAASGKTNISAVDNSSVIKFPLTYSQELKLWTGEIKFDQPGAYSLVGFISNSRDSYSREINSVTVSIKSNIVDVDTNQSITNATITVYERNANTGSFEIWNASSYGQQNPQNASENGGFSLFLPTGEFYLKVDAPDYGSVTSLITKVDQYGSVTASIKMKKQLSVWNRLFASSGDDTSANFPLSVTPMPHKEFLQIGKKVPDITLINKKGKSISMFSKLAKKPTIIIAYSSWNTLAQEQLKIFDNVSVQFGDKYNYIPISTMEPGETSINYITRGQYILESYKASDQFFDDYMIISLPHFFILDENNNLIGNIVGPQAEANLITQIQNIMGNK